MRDPIAFATALRGEFPLFADARTPGQTFVLRPTRDPVSGALGTAVALRTDRPRGTAVFGPEGAPVPVGGSQMAIAPPKFSLAKPFEEVLFPLDRQPFPDERPPVQGGGREPVSGTFGRDVGNVLRNIPVLGGVLGGLAETAIGVLSDEESLKALQDLARAGVIRGDVGEALVAAGGAIEGGGQGGTMNGMNGNRNALGFAAGPILVELAKILGAGAAGAAAGELFDDDGGNGESTVSSLLESLFGGGNGGASGVRPNAMTCPGLFRTTPASQRIPSRVYVDNPDGSVQVLYNAGRASIGSRESALMRSIARRQGFVVRRRKSGGR